MPTIPKPKKPKKPKLDPNVPARLSEASFERPWCQSCKLCFECKSPFLKPFVPANWTGAVLLVGEGPGEDEDVRSKRPFTGRAGQLLRRLWTAGGLSDNDIALVNAVRCRPTDNATPSMSQVRACRPFLLRTIALLRPRVIVGLGGTALRALTNNGYNNVTKSRGRLLSVPGLQNVLERASAGGVPDESKHESVDGSGLASSEPAGRELLVYVTYHPAAILHGATFLEQRIVDDLKRSGVGVLSGCLDGPPVGSAVAVDTEWARSGQLLTAAVADETTGLVREGDFSDIKAILARSDTLIGHGEGDVEQLVSNGFPVREEWVTGTKTVNSLLVSRMVNENNLKGGYELETLLLGVTNAEPWKKESVDLLAKDPDKDFANLPAEVRMRRCLSDAWASAYLARYYGRQLADKVPLVRLTHQIANTLSRLSLAGAFVDLESYREIGSDLEQVALQNKDQLLKSAYAAGMTVFEPTNDGHIRELLFERLGLEVLAKTKKEGLPSVSQDVLRQLDHETVRILLAHNKADTLYRLNIAGLVPFMTPCGVVEGTPVAYLPFHFNPLGAKTGRRSAYDPNSQNWKKKMRAMIRSRWPGGRIGAFDYRKLEMVLIAWVAKDDQLMHDFTVGGGYIAAAKRILGIDVQDGTDLYRGIKSIILGVDYRMGVKKMAWNLWLGPYGGAPIRFSDDYREHTRITGEYRDKYLRTYRGVARYMDEREAEVLRNNRVVSASGRVRNLPLPEGRETPGYPRLVNQAVNFPIQSLASDVTGVALVEIERELLSLHGLSYVEYLRLLMDTRKKFLTSMSNNGIIQPLYDMSVIFNEVHDEVTVDLHPDYRKRDTELIIDTMCSVKTLRKLIPGFDCPLGVDPKIGTRWGLNDEGA